LCDNIEMEFIKEKIKYYTEWSRGLYGLIILISSGLATLIINKSYLESKYKYDITIIAASLDTILFILIVIVNFKIYRNIKSLKK